MLSPKYLVAGGAVGVVSYCAGILSLPQAAILAVVAVVTCLGVASVLQVDVPPPEPKPKKTKAHHPAVESEKKKGAEKKPAKQEEEDDEEEKPVRQPSPPADDDEPEEQELSPTEKKNKKKKKKKDSTKDAAPPPAQPPAKKEQKTEPKTEQKPQKTEQKVEKKPAKVEQKTEKKAEQKTQKPKAESPATSDTKNSQPKAKAEKTEPKAKAPAEQKVEAPAVQPEEDEEEQKEASPAPAAAPVTWEEVKSKPKAKKNPDAPTPVVAGPSDPSSVAVHLRPESLGNVIGKNGSNLKMIQEATGATIEIPRDGADARVSGPPAGVAKAVNALQQLMIKGFSDITHGQLSDGIIVPDRKRPVLIGQSGSTIKMIQGKFPGVKINLPERGSDAPVTVVGNNTEQVQSALRCIAELVDKGYSEATHPYRDSIEVPASSMGALMGKQGVNVRELETKYRVKILVEGTTAMIAGEEAQHVKDARARIAEMIPPPIEPQPVSEQWTQQASSAYVDAW